MYRRIIILCCVLCVALTQAGCIGIFILNPEECKNETPFTNVHDIFWKRTAPKEKILGIEYPEVLAPKPSSKAEFLKDWGEPDKIISNKENMETWIYNRKLWCGVVPVLILPIPLILPVCDGFDRIDFKENNARNLYTRSIVWSVGLIIMPPISYGRGVDAKDPACRYPLSTNNGVDSGAPKPAEQVTP